MPFSSTQITGAKFIVAAFYEYYISLVAVAPLLVGFGYAGHASLYFWIGTAVTVLFLPLLPYAAVISMLIMRVFGSARTNSAWQPLSAFGVVFFGMAFSMISNYVQHMHKANLEQTMEHMMALAKDIMWLFPDVPFFVNVSAQSGHPIPCLGSACYRCCYCDLFDRSQIFISPEL